MGATPGHRRRQTSPLYALVGLTMLGTGFAAGPASASEWYVGCARDSGEVVVGESLDEQFVEVVSGPFPGRRTAGFWAEENCPGMRCAPRGACAVAAAPPEHMPTGRNNAPATDEWVAGELSSVPLANEGAAATTRSPATVAGPTVLQGPGAANLGPLIDTAKAAAGACNFRAALAGADHMLNFAPDHPWLEANHDTLRELARRQLATEQTVWQAGSALSSGKLKHARKLALAAADSALSCQTTAVAGLLRGIDTTIEQRRMERSARMGQAAAALLPGLIDMARVMSGAANAGAPPRSIDLAAATAQALGVALPGGPDPCAFAYEYRDLAGLAPSCTCAGYVFDSGQLLCVPAGG